MSAMGHDYSNNPMPLWEPKEAFPYSAPGEVLREKYQEYYKRSEPLADRWLKNLLDKTVALAGLLIVSPIFLILFTWNLLEGLLIPSHRGSLIFSYNAVSRGKVFRKYKIRAIAEKYIDKQMAQRGDWHAFAKEWSPQCRTYVGAFAKKFYLDELPQLVSVLIGDISLVGPRPLACHHYQRDVEQGNVFRKLIKGGLLGPSQCLKGSPQFGQSEIEFEYLDHYAKQSDFGFFWTDIKMIYWGVVVMVKGKGL